MRHTSSRLCRRTRRFAFGLALLSLVGAGASLRAGGVLEQIDITGNVPSPIPGHVVGRLVGIRWDARAIPVRYSMNNSLQDIPNPLGPAFLKVADAQAELQRSFDQWNAIPTSYIEMRVTGTTANAGLRGFDFVNELTFRTASTFDAIASSPSVTLIADSDFAAGDDIDGDGDSDVSAAIASAQDVDADGDIEFPVGLYKAGTILDNDVQFNTKTSNGLRFTTLAEQADTVSRSVDLAAVAVHEFGHSHGLSHLLSNQKSDTDGNGPTMYPFIDTGDPAAELAMRTLDSDDLATSSMIYPEGTAKSGPAALRQGDVAFSKVYGLVEGTVTHGVLNEPIAGASVFAVNALTGEVTNTAISGTTQVSVSPTGGLFLLDPAFNIQDGRFVMALPKGIYKFGVEAIDGNPVPAASISLTAQIGSAFGQLTFDEEFFTKYSESDVERWPAAATPVVVLAGKTVRDIDIVTNRLVRIDNFGNRNFIGFTGQPGGSYYAVQIPAAQIQAASTLLGGPVLVHSAQFDTTIADASVPVVFSKAMITTGTVASDGSVAIDLDRPLVAEGPFVAQDNDFAPLFVKLPQVTGWRIQRGIERGEIQNLFLVLKLGPSPFPGVSALPPLIGLDGGVTSNDVPIFGLSYSSTDGMVFTRSTAFNFRFSLALSAPPAR